MIHELKILPHFFREGISGRKTFELRKNDRPFRKGDLLALNEYDYVTMAIKPCVVWKKDRPRNEMTIDFDYSVPYATRESEVQGG